MSEETPDEIVGETADETPDETMDHLDESLTDEPSDDEGSDDPGDRAEDDPGDDRAGADPASEAGDDHSGDDQNDGPLPPPGQTLGFAPAPVRRLYRDPSGPIAGVATGIARFFGVDPLLVQLLFVLFALLGGLGIGLYIALWLLLPTVSPDGFLVRPERWQTVVGAVILGLMLFSGAAAIGIPLAGGLAIILILSGVLLLSQRQGTSADLAAQFRETFAPRPYPEYPAGQYPAAQYPAGQYPAPGQAPVQPYAPHHYPPAQQPPPAQYPPTQYTPAQVQFAQRPAAQYPAAQYAATEYAAGQYPIGPYAAGTAQTPYGWATPRTEPADYARAPIEPAPPRPPITTLTLAVAVLATGVMLVLGSVVSVSAAAAWGVFALICGAGLVVSAFTGRGAWLLLIPASFGLIGMSAAITTENWSPSKWASDWSVGQVDIAVSIPADLNDEYSIGVGELNLDLTRLDLTEDERFEISVGVGEANILVPDDMNVVLQGNIGQGEANFFGENISTVDDTFQRTRRAGGETAPQLIINADIGLGELNVKNG